jgi:aspartyl-tRNA(Asn)/glutamyl-tRNA(Gln) amidotransferase subunit B
VEYEIERQIEQLEKGERITQETRGWDDAKQKTFSQRSKEEAHDYRYMPDPDLPPIEVSDADIEAVRAGMPVMPDELRRKLAELKLDPSTAETLVEELRAGRFMLQLLDSGANSEHVKRIANWLASEVQGLVGAQKLTWENAHLDTEAFMQLAELAAGNKVSSTGAKAILMELVTSGGSPERIATDKNLLQVSDESEIAAVVAQVLADNPKAAEDVKNGEMKAIGFLVGQVMKASQGKANPQLAQELIRKQLQA